MDPIQFGLSLDCLCSYETSPSLKPQLDWIGLDWVHLSQVSSGLQSNPN